MKHKRSSVNTSQSASKSNKSFSSSNTRLPILNNSYVSSSNDTSKIMYGYQGPPPSSSGDLVALKRYLNKLNNEINKLKIANFKLQLNKEHHTNCIREAIEVSQTTNNPINLNYMIQAENSRNCENNNLIESDDINNKNSNNNNHNNNENKSTLPSQSVAKLQFQKYIYSIKREISKHHELLTEKQNEIEKLKVESKVTKLIDRSNCLRDTLNKTNLLISQVDEIEHLILPQKEQKKQSLLSLINYNKTVNTALKNEVNTIIDKYNEMKSRNTKYIKDLAIQAERHNNNRYRYNMNKQIENKRINEIKNMNDKLNKVPELKSYIENNNGTINDNTNELNKLKDEVNEKDNQIKQLEEENNKIRDEMRIHERNIRKEVNKEKDEFKKIRDENDELDKKLCTMKNELHQLIQTKEKLDTIIKKKKSKKTKDNSKGFIQNQTLSYCYCVKDKVNNEQEKDNNNKENNVNEKIENQLEEKQEVIKENNDNEEIK